MRVAQLISNYICVVCRLEDMKRRDGVEGQLTMAVYLGIPETELLRVHGRARCCGMGGFARCWGDLVSLYGQTNRPRCMTFAFYAGGLQGFRTAHPFS